MRQTRSLQPAAQNAYNTKLEPMTDRYAFMSHDGAFAMFLQRDVRLDKGKLTVLRVATADVFVLIIDVPWSVESEKEKNSVHVHLMGDFLEVTFFPSRQTAHKYVFNLMDKLALLSSVSNTVPPPPPPGPDGRLGDVRLVDGSTSFDGRVEKHDGTNWGAVCDNNFNLTDAQVICSQIGTSISKQPMDAVWWNSSEHDCGHGQDVYVSCAHANLSHTNLYSLDCDYLNCALSNDDSATDAFDQDTQVWFYHHDVQEDENGKNVSKRAVRAVKMDDSNREFFFQYQNRSDLDNLDFLRLSADGKGLFAISKKTYITGDQYFLHHINVEDLSTMKLDRASDITSWHFEMLYSAPQRNVMAGVLGTRITLIDTSVGTKPVVGGNHDVNMPCLDLEKRIDDVQLNANGSRVLIKTGCGYRALLDSSDIFNLHLITTVDEVLYADRDILMPNDNSLIVYSKHSSGSTSINSTVLYPADITMYLGATQVGMRFKRQIVAKTQSLTNFEFQLVGLADAPETLGLELGSDGKEITGDIKASFAGQNVSVLIFFNDQDNQRRSQHFDLHVYSTVRAAIFENKLSLSSKEALLSVKLEIPSLANSTFVKDELSTAHFSEADRVVHLLGVESMVNEQLKVLRYHSSKSESEVSSHSVITKVSDLLSPEVSLSHLGIESFLLANLRYNKYPTVTRKISDLRYTIGNSFIHHFLNGDEDELFSDEDDEILQYRIDEVLPEWLTFDANNLKMIGTAESANPSNNLTFNLQLARYELTLALTLSATDGYAGRHLLSIDYVQPRANST